MTWNYRLIHMDVSSKKEPLYQIHEVYYAEDNIGIEAWTERPVGIAENDKEDIVKTLSAMFMGAVLCPILKESKMPGVIKKKKRKL